MAGGSDTREEAKGKHWLDGTVPQDKPSQAYNVAQVINRLLRRNPPPSGPTQSWPTPTAANWESIEEGVDITCAVLDEIIESQAQTPDMNLLDAASMPLMKLWHELSEVLYNLLAGHMPNLDLDVTSLMRYALHMDKLVHSMACTLVALGDGSCIACAAGWVD